MPLHRDALLLHELRGVEKALRVGLALLMLKPPPVEGERTVVVHRKPLLNLLLQKCKIRPELLRDPLKCLLVLTEGVRHKVKCAAAEQKLVVRLAKRKPRVRHGGSRCVYYLHSSCCFSVFETHVGLLTVFSLFSFS